MNHVMLDVDGTLIQSYEFDEQCFMEAIYETTGIEILNNWETYPDVTDRGILRTFIERQAPLYSLEELENLVKPVFIRNIKRTVEISPVTETLGAKAFVSHLLSSDRYIVSVATGGWGETARIKLASAGFDIDKLVIMSSNEHYSRIKIMEMARAEIDLNGNLPVTYFGDAQWDIKACDELGINLVIVGHRVSHHQRIQDFSCLESALCFVK
uniref:HAD family hydrolase n=1 Tax=Thaumasiovibrio occultus TaxID=1891184 RepID=UPI000B364567|nr:HAD family hydrolase [Thaumasiovibrio occultus]